MFNNNRINSFLITVFICLIIPNAVIFSLANYSQIDNIPIINIDFFLAIAFLIYNQKVIGFIIYTIFFIIDALKFSLIFFPFIKLDDIIYLSNFIFVGQSLYLILLLFLIIVLFIEIFILKKIIDISPISKKTFFLLSSILISILLYTKNSNNYIYSATTFFFSNHSKSFLEINHQKLLEESPFPNSTKSWFHAVNTQTSHHRLLLIVAESLGSFHDKTLTEEMLRNLTIQKSKYSLFEYGDSPMLGATVAGEIRELCHLQPQTLDLQKIPSNLFKNCLPNLLAKQGYETYALHAASSAMYDRPFWYPQIGFKHQIFSENLPNYRKCHAFNGVCDIDLNSIILSAFSSPQQKTFFYWLTLNTHANYDPTDLINPSRINCKNFNIDETSDTCNYLKLHTQFFDNLALLLKAPEMKNVEVIIAGDHPPPMINHLERIRYLKLKSITWLHIVTKP